VQAIAGAARLGAAAPQSPALCASCCCACGPPAACTHTHPVMLPQAAHSPGVASSSDGDDVCDDTSPSSSSRSPVSWCAGALVQDGAEPGDEVSVLIWPGGTIEHWPRGTTVAQVVRAKVGASGCVRPSGHRDTAACYAAADVLFLYNLGHNLTL
jgi:hypothetical protein